MITDGSKGHSSDVDGGDDEDDDFVVPPPKKLRTPTVYISSEEQQAMETLAGQSERQESYENINMMPPAGDWCPSSEPKPTRAHDAPQVDVSGLMSHL
jgi:hypothetical protein